MAGQNPSMVIRITGSIAELKRNLAEGKNQIETTTAAMSKLAASLDGSKLEQRAHNITAAVNQVGGATKLTVAEAQRLVAPLDAWIAKAGRVGKQVPDDILKTHAALKQVVSEAEKPPALFDRISAKAVALGSVMAGALGAMAWGAVNQLASSLGTFVGQGAKLPALQQSFESLARGIGQDGKAMLENMSTATRGLVGNYDLLQSANKAILLGLPVTSQSMGELAKTATILGRAMGQDATKSLDDLITALGRSSPMILDNLGLTVKVGEANEAYAAKLGKSADQLTDAERKMAFYDAAMEAARKKTAELGDQTRTLGEIATSVWVSVGNGVSSFAATMNEGIGRALSRGDEFIALLQKINQYGVGAGLVVGAAGAAGRGAQQRNQRAMDVEWDLTQQRIASYQASLNQPAAPAVDYVAQLAKLKTAVAALTPEMKAQIAAMQALGKSTEDITKRTGISADVQRVLTNTVKEAKTAAKSLAEQYRDNLAEVKKYEDAAAKVQATTKTYNALMLSTSDLLTKVSRNSVNARISQTDLTRALDDDLETWLRYQQILAGVHEPLAKLPGELIEIVKRTKPVLAELPELAKTMGENLRTNLYEQLKSIPQTIANAFTGGGGILGAIKSVATGIGAAIGGSIGFAVGGPLGSAIGSALGSLSGLLVEPIAKLFDRNKGRDLVQKWVTETFGGFTGLQKKLQAVFDPATAERYWIAVTQAGRNNQQQAQAAIDEVTKALDAQAARLVDTQGKVNALIAAHLGAGAVIPPAIQASIDKLVEMGRLTADNAQEILGLADAAPSFDQVKAAADALGLTLDGIGGKIANMAFAEKVGAAAEAFETLELAGADMGAVFEQSLGKVQPLVTEALKFGKDMPDAMRPWLQKMVDAGLLVDESGEKLKDLSGLKFAEPLSKKFDDLILKIGELVDAIKGGVGGALDDIGNRVVRPRISPYVDPFPAWPSAADAGPEWGGQQAKGGDYWVTRPTMFVAGEAGPERATFTPGGRGAGQPLEITVVSKLDGREVARNQVRYLPGQLLNEGL